MRVVIDTNVFVSAGLKEESVPGIAAHKVVKSGLLLKSAITTDSSALSRLAARAVCGGRVGADQRPDRRLP
jgi:hypothetical protein